MTAPATLKGTDDLVRAGLVPGSQRDALDAVARRYAVGVSPAMSALIDARDARDPIGLQFLPDARELDTMPDERPDPTGDDAHSPVPGLVHRHADRVLLKIVSVCPVYCRFCFRRETVGPAAGAMSPAEIDAVLAYVGRHPEIREVILTGGDPFMLSARRVRDLVRRLAGISHVDILRWHTRVPAVAPERVTAAFVRALRDSRMATYVVLHANHPRELTPAARAACSRLADAGIPLLSQSVLLAGVNDDIATLRDLMYAFVAARVKPYYLHQLDRAPGTARFEVDIERARALVRTLRAEASGLCQPTYVFDIPGGHGKVPIGPDHLIDDGAGRAVEDLAGSRHPYPRPAGQRRQKP